MTAKQYLSQAIQYERIIRSKRRLIQQLRDLSCAVSDESAERIASLEREQAEAVKIYISLTREIRATIDQLDDARYVELLYRRYLCGETWEMIALNTGYDLRYVYRLHGRALLAVARIIQSGH